MMKVLVWQPLALHPKDLESPRTLRMQCQECNELDSCYISEAGTRLARFMSDHAHEGKRK